MAGGTLAHTIAAVDDALHGRSVTPTDTAEQGWTGFRLRGVPMKPAPAVDEDLAPKSDATRPVAGALAVLALVAIVVGAVLLFQGSLHETVPLTVISERAGLVMNPDAKVQLLGFRWAGSIQSKTVLRVKPPSA